MLNAVVTHDRAPTLMLASNTMSCRHTGMQQICQTHLKIIYAAHAAYVRFTDNISSQIQKLPSQVHTAETHRQFMDTVKQLTQQSES